MEIQENYPFRCVLSLKPLVDYLKETVSASSSSALAEQTMELVRLLEEAPELLEPIEDLTLLKRHGDLVQRLMAQVFPPVFWDTEPVAAVVPYTARPFLASPRFKKLFIGKEGGFSGRRNIDAEGFNRGKAIRAYLFILESFYGIHHSFDPPLIQMVADGHTGLDRYFKIRFDFRFVEVLAVNGPKVLTDQERLRVLHHLTEPEVLREILPPQDFELRGFTVLQAVDVTELEVLVALERDLIDQESIISPDGFFRLQGRLRTLFGRPDLVVGLSVIQQDHVLLLNTGCEMNQCCIFNDSRHLHLSDLEGTVYQRAMEKREVVLVHDLRDESFKGEIKEEFDRSGIQSLIVAPLSYKDEFIGTLDIGSPRRDDMGPVDAMLMSHIQPLFSMAVKKAIGDLDTRVQGIINEKCTAIHPTVEWRFRKAAYAYLERLRQGHETEMPGIVFNNLYPLYGVSDIRGSTSARNEAIRKDLSEHLKLALKIVSLADHARSMIFFKELAWRIGIHLRRLESELAAGDETEVVKFLRKEVEAIFDHLAGMDNRVMFAIENYRSTVDPNVGTVYNLRREFEESISILNDTLTTYLDREEAAAQKVFPHYFERHRTDGVDYLIYVGASLLESDEFNEIYLKNLRLWQIRMACGMAWHTERLKSSLKVPLDTAHLVLVQNAPLSIRFRFDEKRFDVDGAYDIRQEIIKSRIDKAVVKGGKERLTQPGKIAVVYSSPDEGAEVRRHMEFLMGEGFFKGEMEILDLEELPGVHGLKSIRMSVDLDSSALAEKAGG
ncbi:MAG: GAF domain-containing protein [Desulfobacterales bacterium]|nr:GAF domain-containing protein [Desulfobacterales bacterium]